MTPRIKICGLTSSDAVQAAVKQDVDYLGFIFHPTSPRNVSPQQAAELTKHIPDDIASVAVTVNADDETMGAIISAMRPTMLQLHGAESPERIQTLKQRYGLPVIKAISVATHEDMEQVATYADSADMLLFDTKSPDLSIAGGTGQVFDWTILGKQAIPLPWFLSGGLSFENIAQALRVTKARYLDISSSLESAPGVKSVAKINELMQHVREMTHE